MSAISFCSPADVVTRYGADFLRGLLDIDDDDVDPQVHPALAAAVSSANDEVAAAVRVQYELPMSNTSAMLRSLAVSLAYFEVLSGRPAKIGDGDLAIRDDARAKLARVRSGAEDIPFRSLAESNVATAPVVVDFGAGDATAGTGLEKQAFWRDW